MRQIRVPETAAGILVVKSISLDRQHKLKRLSYMNRTMIIKCLQEDPTKYCRVKSTNRCNMISRECLKRVETAARIS